MSSHAIRAHRLLIAAMLLLVATLAGAQPPEEQPPTPPAPAGPPPPQDQSEQPPADEVPGDETAEEPVDDGPKPAGIGTSPEPTAVAMPSGRRYGGLFSGARPRGMRGQSLDLTMSAFGGWDEPEDVPVLPGDENERVAVAGPFSGGAATLFYTRPGERLNLSGFGSGFVGYFPDNDDPWYPSYSAGFSGDAAFRVGRRTTLRLAQIEGFATDLSLGHLGSGIGGGVQLPRATGDTAFDNSLRRAPSLTSASEVTLEHGLSSKTTLSTFYGYRNAYFFDTEDDRLPVRHDHRAGMRVRRRFTRDLALRAGYTFRKSWTGRQDEEPRGFHDVDLGVDYSKSLPLSRRTQLYFNTGSTIAASESASAGDDGGTFNDTRFFVVGSAGLLHEIGRSWSAQLGYTRDVGFEDGFGDPFLRDAAVARVGGFLSPRVDLSASAQWTSAAIGLGERNFSAWTASAQIRTAITQSLAAYGTYYYYLQDFDAGVALPPGVVRDLSRQGVRVGLTTWLPLWSSR